ncbi:MAG: hypothetical protein H6977_14575 [Gammaproteobacteria bacterium]|nr:hypothetical protein [Gammaproteobacteria bacterium]
MGVLNDEARRLPHRLDVTGLVLLGIAAGALAASLLGCRAGLDCGTEGILFGVFRYSHALAVAALLAARVIGIAHALSGATAVAAPRWPGAGRTAH